MGYLQYLQDSVIYNLIDAVTFSMAIIVVLRLISLLVPIVNWKTFKNNNLGSTLVIITIIVMFFLSMIAGYFMPTAETNNVVF